MLVVLRVVVLPSRAATEGFVFEECQKQLLETSLFITTSWRNLFSNIKVSYWPCLLFATNSLDVNKNCVMEFYLPSGL